MIEMNWRRPLESTVVVSGSDHTTLGRVLLMGAYLVVMPVLGVILHGWMMVRHPWEYWHE